MGAVIVGAGLVYASKLAVESWTSAQRSRNEILKNEIATLDKQIEEIKGLKNQRERLLARDISVVDMRLPDRLVVRLAHPPAEPAKPGAKGKNA